MSIFEKTNIKDCLIRQIKSLKDDRGEFNILYDKKDVLDQIPFFIQPDQINLSVSKYGVLRGLHYQKGDYAQEKFISVLSGRIIDVVVDCRVLSPTYGKHIKFYMTKGYQLYIPAGCAHGFVSLEDDTMFHYLVNGKYNPKEDSGIIYNDPDLNIDWEIDEKDIILSEKDKNLPTWKDAYKFKWG